MNIEIAIDEKKKQRIESNLLKENPAQSKSNVVWNSCVLIFI